MANIARLGVVLGLNSAEFTQGMERAKKSVTSFAQDAIPILKNAALAGVAAFTGMTYKALQLSDQIADLAAATELSISSVLKISDAYQQSGGKYDDAGKAIQKFSETVDNAAQGSFELQKAFSRVGISLNDLDKLSVEELFYKAIDGISKVSDSATKAGVKMDLFGKSMRNIDVGGFNDQLKEGKGEFDEYALGVKAAADLADKLEKNLKELVLIFTKELAPTLNRIFDTINVKGGASEKVFGGLREIILGFWYGLEKVVITLQKFEIVLNQLPGGSKQFENWGEQLDALDEKARLLKEKIYGAPNIVTLPKITVTSGGDGGDDGRGGRGVKAGKDPAAEQEKKIQAMIRMANLNSVEFEREQKHALEMANSREYMNSLTDNGRKIQEAVNEVMDATSRKIKEIADKREEAVSKEADPRIIKAYDEQIEKIEEMGKKFESVAGMQAEESIAAQNTFSYGWNQAFRQYAEDAENYATVGRDMFQAVTGAMSKAIDAFVETGKFSFKDFAGSIIKELIKIELKMQAMALFRMGFKFLSAGFGGGSTIGEGSLDGGAGALSFPIDMTRANGGTVSANSTYMVGERGAELFMPSRSGTVIPNNNLRDVMGGGGGVTYNGTVIQNMNAIDTQSGLQFLSKNKMNIYALNQSAGRSMPASR